MFNFLVVLKLNFIFFNGVISIFDTTDTTDILQLDRLHISAEI